MPKRVTFHEGIERLAGLADVEEVLKDLSMLLRKTLKSQWAVVYLADRDGHGFSRGRGSGLPLKARPLFRTFPLPPEKADRLKTLLRKRQHVILPDGGECQAPDRLREALAGMTLLGVPMMVRGQLTGMAFVARGKDAPPFTEDDISAARMQVSQAALVISHIVLFDESLEMAVEMGKRIDVIFTLDEINKAISSSLNHEKVIETAMEHVERISQSELTAVLVKEKEQLVVKSVRGFRLEIPGILSTGETVSSQSLAGTSFLKKASKHVSSLAKVRRLSPLDRAIRDAGIEALLAVPLLQGDVSSGVLLLGSKSPNRLGPEDSFAIEKIASQMAVALHNAFLYEEMRNLFISTISSLANAIDAKSHWTKGHSERVMHLAVNIATEMGLDEAEIEKIRLGGLLHDIGKIGIIETLLDKPAILSVEEFPPMRLHPEKGVAILAPIEQLKDVLPGILHHHERYDGTGYPHSLKGENIPLAARIISVADSFDAIISIRPYKQGLSVDHALGEMRRCAGTQFDPAVVEALARYLEKTRAPQKVAAET